MGQKICHDDSLSQITVKMYVLFYTLKFTILYLGQQILFIFCKFWITWSMVYCFEVFGNISSVVGGSYRHMICTGRNLLQTAKCIWSIFYITKCSICCTNIKFLYHRLAVQVCHCLSWILCLVDCSKRIIFRIWFLSGYI